MHGLEWKEEQVERERGRLSPISQLLNAKIFKKPALSKGERSEPLRYLHIESCRMLPMDSHMAGPINSKLSEYAVGCLEIVLAKEFF